MAKVERKTETPRKAAGSSSEGLKLPGWSQHAIVFVLYLIIVLVYFSPLMKNKELYQGDIRQYMGMGADLDNWRKEHGEEALWSDGMFSGMPGYMTSVHFSGNIFETANRILGYTLPFPIGYMLMMFAGFYVMLLLLKCNPWVAGIGAFGFAFSSYFLTLLEAGHNAKLNAIAFIPPMMAGIMVAFSGRLWLGAGLTAIFTAFEINANHFQITYFFAIVPLFLFAINTSVRKIISKSFLPTLKVAGVLLAAGVLGALPNLPRLWTTQEYTKETIRGVNDLADGVDPKVGLEKDYAWQFSYGVSETFTLWVPNFKGGASGGDVGLNSATHDFIDKHPRYGNLQVGDGTKLSDALVRQWPTYYGSQPFTSGPVYVGIIFMFLFLMGIVVTDNKFKWWILGATILSVMLSWGGNFRGLQEFMFDNLPMYNRFRTPSMWLVVAEFCIPLLGALALATLIRQKEIINMRRFYIGFGAGLALTAGLLLMFWVSAPSLVEGATTHQGDVEAVSRMMGRVGIKLTEADASALGNALREDRVSLLRSDSLRGFGLVAAAAALIFFFVTGKLKSQAAMLGGLALLVVVDLYPIDRRYLNDENFVDKGTLEAARDPDATDLKIKQDKDPHYRVLKLTADPFQDADPSAQHKSIGGYHPAKLRRYNDLITHVLSPSGKHPNAGKGEADVLYGIYYGIKQQMRDRKMDPKTPVPAEYMNQQLEKSPAVNMLNTKYVIYEDGNYHRNPYAMGNAWFVSNIKRVNTADEEINALTSENLKTTAIVGKDFEKYVQGFTPQYDSTGTIKLTGYKPYQLDYTFNANAEQLVVFSEIYYDGHGSWKVTIDKNPVEMFRVNYLLRGLRVPKGNHEIVFRFEPKSYYTGNKLALLFSVLVLGIAGAAIYLDYKGKGRKEEENDDLI